jgi:hypothetical protein
MDADGPVRSNRSGYDLNPCCGIIWFRTDTRSLKYRVGTVVCSGFPRDREQYEAETREAAATFEDWFAKAIIAE